MATYNLTTTDLTEHVSDAEEIVNRVLTDVPVTYRVKEILVTASGSGYALPPAVTIQAPPSGGVTATAAASIAKEDGTSAVGVTRIAVTLPGSGYTTVPTVTIVGTATAVAILEVDPVVIERRRQLVDSINAQVIETSVDRVTTELTNIKSTLTDIKTQLDVAVVDNLAATVKNIDHALNDLVDKKTIDVLSVTNGPFKVNEKVTASLSGSTGRVMAFYGNSIVLSQVTGDFQDGETLTGQSSGASGQVDIVAAPADSFTNEQIGRALMTLNAKTTNSLPALKQELATPTSLAL